MSETAEATMPAVGDAHVRAPYVDGDLSGAAVHPAAAFANTADFLLDVRLAVSVEVGRVQMPLRQVMELGPGSIVELNRSTSEPVEVHANGRCIGRGEIVVVGDHFGVRITELGA